MSESQDEDEIIEVEDRDTNVSHNHSDEDSSEEHDAVGIDMGDDLPCNDDEIKQVDDEDDCGESVSEEDMEDDEFDDEPLYDSDDPRDVIESVLMEYSDSDDMEPSIRAEFLVALQQVDIDYAKKQRDRVEALMSDGFDLLGLRAVYDDDNCEDITEDEIRSNDAETRIVCDERSVRKVTIKESGDMEDELLLNFGFTMKEKIKLPDGGETGVFEINPPSDEPIEKEADPTILQEVKDFRDKITGSFFETTFEVCRSNQASVLRDISKKIGRGVKTIQGVHSVGFHDGCYVTPTGVIDESGWVDEPDHRFIAYDGDTEIQKAFEADEENESITDDEVREIVELLCDIRPGERLTPVVGWMFSSLFASEIREKTGMFNGLNVVGQSGCGKSRTMKLLMKLFGFDINPFEISDTAYSIDNKLMSVKDCPVWFDEYIPSNKKDHELNRFHEKYKLACTGGVSSRGSWSGDERSWDLSAPVAVTGESEMSDNALARRTVNVRFSDATTRVQEHRDAFKRLTGKVIDEDVDGDIDIESQFNLIEFSEHLYEFAASVDDVQQRFVDCLIEVNAITESWDVMLDDDEMQGLAVVRLGWELLHEFAAEYGVDEGALPSEDEMVASIHHVAGADENGNVSGRMTEEDEFFSLLSRAAAAGELELEQDYTVVRGDRSSCELRVKTERCYDIVSRYVREHALKANLLESGREYKKRFKQLSEEDDSYVTCHGKRSPPVNRCVGVSVKDLIREVNSVSASDFDGITYDFEEEKGKYDEELMGGGVDEEDSEDEMIDERTGNRIKKLSELEVGDELQSVTVEVVSWETDAGALALDGCVKDVSGMMNVVSFNDVGGSINEGDCLVLSGVSVDEYQGNVQLRLGDETVIKRVQQGVGNIPDEESDAGQSVISRSDEAGWKA